jgi:hypothetical protein
MSKQGCHNIKFIQLQHESVAFMKTAGEEEGYPMATPIPTLTSQINHRNMQNQILKHHKSYREGQAKIGIENPEK